MKHLLELDKDNRVTGKVFLGYIPPNIEEYKDYLEVSKELYDLTIIGDKIDPDTLEIIERFVPEEVEPMPSEIDKLKKENEVLSDKVDNLKEALFELSLYTLKD